MERNSIKANLSKEEVISEIKLIIGADIKNKNIFMVVEGDADIKFLQRFLSDDVYLFESYSGKAGVENIVENSFSSDNRVIGVRDRDYHMEPSSNKIFYYDYCCLEMMMLKNDNTFRNLCAEYYEGEKGFRKLRMDILEALKYISVFRMQSEIEGWRINFDGISIFNVWDAEKKKIKEEDVLEKLKQTNKSKFNELITEKIDHEKEAEWEEEDFYQYTNGHDAFKLLALVCNESRRKKKDIKHVELEASCRCAFGDDAFKETNIYSSLNGYAKNHHLKIFVYEEKI